VVAVNRPLDLATAGHCARIFLEVIVAPSVEPEALDLLSARKVRIIEASEVTSAGP